MKGASLRDRATQASPQAPAGLGHSVSIPSADEMQQVYDLIIHTCQYGPHHEAGAIALRTINHLLKAATVLQSHNNPTRPRTSRTRAPGEELTSIPASPGSNKEGVK
jgi:hypothetical protein